MNSWVLSGHEELYYVGCELEGRGCSLERDNSRLMMMYEEVMYQSASLVFEKKFGEKFLIATTFCNFLFSVYELWVMTYVGAS